MKASPDTGEETPALAPTGLSDDVSPVLRGLLQFQLVQLKQFCRNSFFTILNEVNKIIPDWGVWMRNEVVVLPKLRAVLAVDGHTRRSCYAAGTAPFFVRPQPVSKSRSLLIRAR